MSKEKWIRVAVYIDGEGGLDINSSLHHSTAGTPCTVYMCRVHVTNASMRLMKWLVKNFGGAFNVHNRSDQNPNHQQCYRWYFKGGQKKLEKFLLAILPYLLIKRE